MQGELIECPLGVPEGRGDYGPDLTFIPLPASSSLRGTCSFWNLDRSPEEIIRTFAIDRACIVNVGYPAFKHEVTVAGNDIRTNITLYGGNGALLQKDIVQVGDWDYINSECDYGALPNLPESFVGMSGGGIWSALLGSDKAGALKAKQLGLVGVNFWETPVEEGIRNIRGHFVRSIYRRAWDRQQDT